MSVAPGIKLMIQLAIAVRENAYAPYSQFQVGAAALTAKGAYHLGCNVENISFGLTNCAERVAMQSAIVAGASKLDALAIASPGGVTPCGACRQVLAEFNPDLVIYLVDVEQSNKVVRTTLTELLPQAFKTDIAAR